MLKVDTLAKLILKNSAHVAWKPFAVVFSPKIFKFEIFCRAQYNICTSEHTMLLLNLKHCWKLISGWVFYEDLKVLDTFMYEYNM